MVGVPTSNRCDNCRIRKKKCGEQRPSCAECIRSGWDCPGYPPRWKFVNETPRLKKLYSRRRYIFESNTTSPDVMRPEKIIFGSIESGSDLFLLENFEVVSPEIPRFHDNNPLATKLMYCLGCKVKGDLVPLWLIGSFFQYIPGRLGYNIALDDAITCVCSLYCDRSSKEYTKSKAIYRNYVRALSSLQKCLVEERLRFQSETLCASLLLQMCELVVNVDKAKWIDLARGTSQLIQARGVGRYKDPFDLGMLESQLSYIVIQSARFKEDCYLRQPEWRALLATTSAWPSNTITTKELKSLELRIELCHQLFEIPSILMEASSFLQNSGGLLAGSYPIFMDNILEICSKMKAWLSCGVEPHIFPNPWDKAGATVQYSDPIAGVVDCVANTTLLTLDKVICSLYHGSMATHAVDTFDDPEVVEGWYRRAIKAYDFVQSESTFAAKPLGIGLRQFQTSSPKPLAETKS
ncbi:uncharacterized protein EAE98_007018 [Botrytis deweyae]|uniref:Zn(2)-C6 fungal-type domain-containing protein n=1 Tax=Botrytis deweyae TaxID=2478750 RepID=A0ABQ7IHT7_9HELO|nr:uncharacterized protein EAE98_007018 [Botrytis deweyae]KAF7924930.1 hypothetical protein EAE98_007018 [Botrytis deweyae]